MWVTIHFSTSFFNKPYFFKTENTWEFGFMWFSIFGGFNIL